MTGTETPKRHVRALRTRREFILQAGALGVAGISAACHLVPASSPTPTPYPVPTYLPTMTPSDTFTDWGWPLPYAQVSAKSVQWLKNRGWWPLVVGHQPFWSGANAVNAVLEFDKLFAVRGLDVVFLSFQDATATVQGFASSRLQVCTLNSSLVAQLIQSGAPVAVVAIVTPNLEAATVVPNASHLQSLSQLKGSASAIGIVPNSLADTYLIVSAAVNGLTVGQDFYLKALILKEEATLPATVSAVVPQEPVVSEITEQLHTGRRIDVVFPYIFSHGNLVIRRELIESAPDVAQALVDSYVEGILFVRLQPRSATALLAKRPDLRGFSQSFLLAQTQSYNNLYKPTFLFPFVDFWSIEDASVTTELAAAHQLAAPLDVPTWQRFIIPTFAQNSFARLGWRLPNRPPWIPKDWTGSVGRPPYPEYPNVSNMRQPQPWPESGDLTRPWKFAGTTYNP